MCVVYVRFGSKVRPRTFGCVATGSAVLFILSSSLLLYSAVSGMNRVQVVLSGFSVRLFYFVQAQHAYLWKTIHSLSNRAPPPTLNTSITFTKTIKHATHKKNRSINRVTHNACSLFTRHMYIVHVSAPYSKVVLFGFSVRLFYFVQAQHAYLWKTIHSLSKRAPPPTLNTSITFTKTVKHTTHKKNRSINWVTHKACSLFTCHMYIVHVSASYSKVGSMISK